MYPFVCLSLIFVTFSIFNFTFVDCFDYSHSIRASSVVRMMIKEIIRKGKSLNAIWLINEFDWKIGKTGNKIRYKNIKIQTRTNLTIADFYISNCRSLDVIEKCM